MIKELVGFVIKELVEAPEKVNVQVFRDAAKAMIEIQVAADDFKRVIGKDGRIIKAVRALVDAVESGPHEVLVDIAP
jgi:predicted RNA-binding protein YlqC (UPF0109 family)